MVGTVLPSLTLLAALFLAPFSPAATITEIHYRPPAGEEHLEFIEITNDTSTPEDLSGWRFVEGIDFEFPERSILSAKAKIVVCADVEALSALHGIGNAIGNFTGRLDSGGERLTLVNQVGVVIQSLRYRDEGQWPVGPDGTGHTLSLLNRYLDPSEPESWRRSLELGGTPGKVNFAANTLDPRQMDEVLEQFGRISFNELYRGVVSGEGWVELFNDSSEAQDLTDYRLVQDPESSAGLSFASGTTIAAGGFLAISESEGGLDFSLPEVRLFLLDADGRVKTAAVFDRQPPETLASELYSEARVPDGGRLGYLTATPTRGLPNQVALERDIVINEIFYHPPADPPGVERSEFVELTNRGALSVDLSEFRFTRGISFTFPRGTTLAPGAYRVVAENRELVEAHHGITGVLGNFEGVLANGGENLRLVDALGNLVDEVHYHDGGQWSLWADGRGASLELIDPQQDNDVGMAWAASDETEKSAWEEYSYRVPSHSPSSNGSPLKIMLVERGRVRIDDVSITDFDGLNHIENPGFESDTENWQILGTHGPSRRVSGDAHTGSACLEIDATGKGNSRGNAVIASTAPALAPGQYDVSLAARWLGGSSVLVFYSEYSNGQYGGMSGNTLGHRLRLPVPLNLGTPGKENSATQALREETGSDNLGPLLSEVTQLVAVPREFEATSFRVRIADSDGVARATLFVRREGVGSFQAVPLLDDGLSNDLRANDSYFGGSAPGFADLERIAYYIEAEDRGGRIGRWPAAAPERTAAYIVLEPATDFMDRYRVVVDAENTLELTSRPLHSNRLLDGSFIFNELSVHQNVGVRYRGSPWGRPPRNNYRIRFQKDRPFRRGRIEMNLTSRGTGNGSNPEEGIAYFLIGRNGTPSSRAPTSDYHFVQGFFNDTAQQIKADQEPVNSRFLERWYRPDFGGPVLKADGRKKVTESSTAWDPVRIQYRGENTEDYRLYFFHSVHQTRDNWQPLIDFYRQMDPEHSPDEAFDETYEEFVDVEAFMRVLAPRILMDDGDALFVGNGHNGYLVRDDSSGLWGYLAFDMDGRFNSNTTDLFRLNDASVIRMLRRPLPRRTYFRVLNWMADHYWSVGGAFPWLAALSKDTGMGTNTVLANIQATQGFIKDQLEDLISATMRPLPPRRDLIETGEAWRARRGTGPFSETPGAWQGIDFDDSGWEPMVTPIGFNAQDVATDLSDMQNNYTSLAIRNDFDLSADELFDTFFLEVSFDDGYCAYVNGRLFGFANCEPAADFDSVASTSVLRPLPPSLVEIPRELLSVGRNVISILGLNRNKTNRDFLISPRIFAESRDISTPDPRILIRGEAPIQVVSFLVSINQSEFEPFEPEWEDVLVWKQEFELEADDSQFLLMGLDEQGDVVSTSSFLVQTTAFSEQRERFIRGDSNRDGRLNLADALSALRRLFVVGAPKTCADAADFDDNGKINLGDPLGTLEFLFRGGQPPRAPFPDAGTDPTPDLLGCERSATAQR